MKPLITLLLLSLCGCCTGARYDNARRLVERQDWASARDAAPAWCRDALRTINDLEYELERK